jgi:hypothetical protein
MDELFDPFPGGIPTAMFVESASSVERTEDIDSV